MRILWVVLTVLLIDQATKVWVRTSMSLGQSIPVLGDWLKLTYTENPGMAFGITFGMPLLVTFFSIVATILIVLYLWYLRTGSKGYRFSLALILGGALGNIIDRVFYGKIFGYGDLFRGKVVDFIHVDVWRGWVSESVPFIGGSYLSLFPIWNVADMAIVIGVVFVLFFQHNLRIEEEMRLNEVESSHADVPVPDPADMTPAPALSNELSLDVDVDKPD